ncbi:hypothetical protein Tco_1324044 [Tanacetum coccineum]
MALRLYLVHLSSLYMGLDRITCEETKNLWSFLEDFRQLAIKSRKLYFPSTTEKLFTKLPPSLSKKIEESFKAKHPGLSAGVFPAIKFTHNFISEMCKDTTLAKELRDLSLCSTIPILGYYKNNRKKYGIRKQRTWEKWSTLGEPFGKWDYYVKYDAPTNITPIEEITATGWGDKFSDKEATPGLWSDVISRWESITINRLNSQTWSDNKEKLAFVENLLGESKKLMWQQWRTVYPGAYSLAIKSGKLYFPSTTEKLFAKLPPSLSKKIEESFKAKHPGLSAGVLPAIKFTHTFVSEMCKDAALAKELRDLSLCSAIPIPGHFAKDYRSKQGNIVRSAVYQELDLDDNKDIVSVDFDDTIVYSISEGEGDVHQNINIMVQDTPFEKQPLWQ